MIISTSLFGDHLGINTLIYIRILYLKSRAWPKLNDEVSIIIVKDKKGINSILQKKKKNLKNPAKNT